MTISKVAFLPVQGVFPPFALSYPSGILGIVWRPYAGIDGRFYCIFQTNEGNELSCPLVPGTDLLGFVGIENAGTLIYDEDQEQFILNN